MSDERDELMAVWDDDVKFDKFLKELDNRRKTQSKTGGKKVHVSKEEYLRKYAKVHGEG